MPDPGFTAPLTTSGFATNYIHGGARYEFGQQNVHPFLGLGVGATIFDPSKDGIGSSTNFSLSAEGGVRMMLGKGAQQRFGIRATFRGWFSSCRTAPTRPGATTTTGAMPPRARRS